MLDATLCGEAGAVAANPSRRGPGSLPNSDPPIVEDDPSSLPGGTLDPSLESAVVPRLSSTLPKNQSLRPVRSFGLEIPTSCTTVGF